jgi:tetratricopeptide (TPR) repeat protein
MVKAWRETVTIPTYEVGKPEKNPMFLEKRVYQGSSGVVYPYPVIESISDEKVDKDWQAVWLENEYIKVMILPELGGRVQMAYDKIKQRHFVYYNHVIKPALVGLAGPWISGGIEFNWPQHHRPSTYIPVDSTIVENEDGSVTVWVNEMERMFHQKGMAGFTLRPGCAYLEIQGRVSNRTPLPQTFLWWANPAVEVNDQYQSVFPPDVNAVFDHGKRAVSSFPIATGTYYKMDYSAGVDISNYKNIFVPTSYMAVNSKYDFEGGYENDTKGGMLHVASHHLSPGKKQWTWGNGDFGRAWDRNLTDDATVADGLPVGSIRTGFRPYIELMAGVYTENQPDFTWLMPYEEKQFTQYFMPYRELGIVKQASKDFILNIEKTDDGVCFKVLATSKKDVRVILEDDKEHQYYNKVVTLSPEEVLVESVQCPAVPMQDLHLIIDRAENPRMFPLLEWRAEPDEIRPIPDAAEAALSPQDTKTIDQLYLTGLHLEQYRHATWSALDYYEEALRRDPLDYRCNMQMGLWYLRRARFHKAKPYLETAVRVQKRRNPNPYDGEALFYLGVVSKFTGRMDVAYDCFWKSTWNKAWADAGYYQAACISTAGERWEEALNELERCLISNSHNHQACALKAVVLRKLGRKDEAHAWIKASYGIDTFNYVCMMEEHLLTGDKEPLERMISLMHNSSDNYDETALEYCAAGLHEEAMTVWQVAVEQNATSPMTYYYMGRYAEAEQADSAYCFPNRLEAALALEKAKEANPNGAKAPYYLGCLYYDKRQYNLAIENWELSAKLDPCFPSVWRNLALARFNKQNRQEEALACMEKAFHLDETDARTLMELDQLYKRLHKPHQLRLDFLRKYPSLVQQRDDLVLEEATLLNQLGRFEEAKTIIDNRIFHPWEGGEGKVSGQYQFCRVEIAKKLLKKDPQSAEAKRLLEECLVFPQSLGEGKLYGAQDNDFLYFLGRYEEGTVGPTEPAAAMYYNDAKPDKIFYAGLCYRKLGQEDKARGLFNKLINYGKQHIYDKVVMDYFAVSLPDLLIWEDSLDTKNRIHCLYMLALGYFGMGDKDKALKYLSEVETLDNNHQGAQQLRTMMG